MRETQVSVYDIYHNHLNFGLFNHLPAGSIVVYSETGMIAAIYGSLEELQATEDTLVGKFFWMIRPPHQQNIPEGPYHAAS